MNEAFSVMRYELGCNGIRLMGDCEEAMLRAARMCAAMGFEKILLSPFYLRKNKDPNSAGTVTFDEHRSNIVAFSKRAESLRTTVPQLVLVTGNELTMYCHGIVPGSWLEDRRSRMTQGEYQRNKEQYDRMLNGNLSIIVNEIRSVFHGPITYAKPTWERVDWKRLGFDIVGANEYYASDWDSDGSYLKRIQQLKSYGLPVFITEFGADTFEGASRWGGGAHTRYTTQPYSEEEQSRHIQKTLDLLLNAAVDATFVYAFVEKSAPRYEPT